MKRFMVLVLAAVFCSSLMVGCNRQSAGQQLAVASSDGYQETLIIGRDKDIKGFDSANDDNVSGLPFNTLFVANSQTNEIEGCLVDTWESDDMQTWKFTLRKGVKFHNGEELKAEDIKYTLERCAVQTKSSRYHNNYAGIETPDDYTVIVHLKIPNVSLPMLYCSDNTFIISRKSETAGKDGKFYPVGTGPYIIREWVPGDHVTFDRFDDYFEGTPKTKTIIYRLIPEDSSRLIAVQTGEIDGAENIPNSDVDTVQADKNLALHSNAIRSSDYFCMNMKRKPFDDIRVRQALDYAANRQELLDGVLNNMGETGSVFLAPGTLGRDSSVWTNQFNPEKAKELLKEAGYPNGFKMSITVSSGSARKASEILQAQFADIGVTVDLDFLEGASFQEKINRGDFDVFIRDKNNSSGDPAIDFMFVLTQNQGKAGNRGFYSNPTFDNLYEECQKTLDDQKRHEIIREMQKILADDVPWLILYYPTLNIATKKNLKGLPLPVNDRILWETAYIEN
jgi:peptide/nickel transport system substrate-binding protein